MENPLFVDQFPRETSGFHITSKGSRGRLDGFHIILDTSHVLQKPGTGRWKIHTNPSFQTVLQHMVTKILCVSVISICCWSLSVLAGEIFLNLDDFGEGTLVSAK